MSDKRKDKFKNVKGKPLTKKAIPEWQGEFRSTEEREPKLYSKRSMLVLEALEYFKNGNYEPSLVPKCAVRWGYKERNVRNIFEIARKRFNALWEGEEQEFKNKFLARYEYLYKKNLATENYVEARNVVKEQARLMGLDVIKSQVTIDSRETLVESLLNSISKKNEKTKDESDSTTNTANS